MYELKFSVIDLVCRAYPNITEESVRVTLACANFRNALKPEIRHKLAWVLSEDTTLDAMVERAAQIERGRKWSKRCSCGKSKWRH